MSSGPPPSAGRPAMTPERALAHPLRAQILSELADQERSPVQLAAELGEPLGVVSYHVRVLAQAGLLELVDRTFKRGAVQHHYRARDVGIVTARLSLTRDRAQALSDQVSALLDAARGDVVADGDVELTVLLHRTSGTERG